MALATQCPHCHTTFRVAADQLKLRGGIVRCGACQSIFDGNAHLVDLSARPAPASATPPASAPVHAPASQAQPRERDADGEPVYTLDFTHTFDPFGILPGVAADDADADADATVPAAETAAPLSSHPMAAQAVPAAPTAPQVWRTASTRQATSTEAAPAQADAAAAAAAGAAPGSALAAAADVPVDAAGPGAYDAAQPSYAPSGRIEPRLEPVPGQDLSGAPADADDAPASQAPAAEALPAGMTANASFVPRERVVPQPAVSAESPTESATGPAPAPALPPAPQERVEPSFDLPVDEEIVAQALPHEDGHEADELQADAPPIQRETVPATTAPAPAVPAPAMAADAIPAGALPQRASATGEAAAAAAAPGAGARSARARSLDARTRRSSLKPTRIEAPKLRLPQDDADEPEFVRRSRRQERFGRTRRILMGAGSAVLLLALAAQLVLTFRNGLAARNPGLKPALQAVCGVLGCRVELPARAADLAIETGELATLGPDTYSLNTLLRNQGNLVQAWPSIELELTDADNKPVLRRVFGPQDYLPPGVPAAAGFGPRSEQAIRLHFALADVKPSDYHLFVFYP